MSSDKYRKQDVRAARGTTLTAKKLAHRSTAAHVDEQP